MDGVDNTMKIYAGNRDDDSSFEYSEVDIECTKKELDVLISLLIKFQYEINLYLGENIHRPKSELGFAHMHYQDNNEIWKESDADVVVHVDLSK